MIVLSLFDGMSCGRIALERAGIPVTAYYASEIDKYAMQVSKANWSDVIHLGDVTQWRTWNIPTPDLIIAGSPCQGFSSANRTKVHGDGFEHEKSRLYYVFLDIMRFYQSKWFVLENVSMKREFVAVINEDLKREPVKINSNLVSAQNRSRLYWTNIPNQAALIDRIIYLKDIVEPGTGKALSATTAERPRAIKNRRQLTDKAVCLLASSWKGAQANGVTIIKDGGHHRVLTARECEKLQTVPVDYTDQVSNTQRIRMLGNGWTVDVISHILAPLSAMLTH
jgi:site-specific DNA-cytosine methylase